MSIKNLVCDVLEDLIYTFLGLVTLCYNVFPT